MAASFPTLICGAQRRLAIRSYWSLDDPVRREIDDPS
jgi:hypothetical protein